MRNLFPRRMTSSSLPSPLMSAGKTISIRFRADNLFRSTSVVGRTDEELVSSTIHYAYLFSDHQLHFSVLPLRINAVEKRHILTGC